MGGDPPARASSRHIQKVCEQGHQGNPESRKQQCNRVASVDLLAAAAQYDFDTACGMEILVGEPALELRTLVLTVCGWTLASAGALQPQEREAASTDRSAAENRLE